MTRSGQVTHYVCMFSDISQEKAQHQRLEFLTQRDSLTGLPNRAWFVEQLDEAMNQALADGEQLAVLLLNLDRFKDVNDSYGHAVGDEVLRHVTQQVRLSLRPGDLVGRMAGDELAVLVRHLRHADGAAAVARHLIDAASKPWRTPGRHRGRGRGERGHRHVPRACLHGRAAAAGRAFGGVWRQGPWAQRALLL